MADAAYGFPLEDHKRVSAATRYVEGAIRGGGVPGRGSTNTPWNPGCLPAVTTSTITARVGTQAGSGTATLQTVSETGELGTGESITVWNKASDPTEGPVASGVEIFVCYGAGKFWVLWEECPAS